MRLDTRTLQHFTGSMATCLAAALPAAKALELSAGRTPSAILERVVRSAKERCANGMPLSEALEPAAGVFPSYFLAVLRAGEASGRQAEAFQLLHQYCLQIGPARRVVRNTWLYPLVCIVFGWVIRTGIFLYFGKYTAAERFAETTFGSAALLALAGWAAFHIPPSKRILDWMLLQLPLVRETELGQTLVLFFSTFRLAYEAGGLSVLRMFDLAWATVRNSAIRTDLLRARRVLMENGTFGEAFAESTVLDDGLKGIIHVGALSGQMDRSLTQIVEKATWQLELSLRIFNQFFQRLVVFSVAMSIVETVLLCIL